MADDFQLGSGNWWESSRTPQPSNPTTLNAIASFAWSPEMADMKPAAAADQSAAQIINWNQQTLLSEKGEGSFRSMLHDGGGGGGPASAVASQEHWLRGFSLDQQQFSSQTSSNDSTITSPNLSSGFPVDSAAAYGLLMAENQQGHHSSMNFGYPSSNSELLTSPPSWNKFSQFLRTSPPKAAPPSGSGGAHLHFANNTAFWNASGTMNDGRSSFYPAQIPMAAPFEEKPKNGGEIRDLSSSSTKKSNNENSSNKRPRNEAPSPLPAFKVRKEKMGDRITALQQLVSPFGKTDTASVLSEAIEYIKLLHDQISVLSTPYMKTGAPTQQHPDKSKDPTSEGPTQDLRSRGLCLVPVSSTFPMTNETTFDFWTPTFGGSFR